VTFDLTAMFTPNEVRTFNRFRKHIRITVKIKYIQNVYV